MLDDSNEIGVAISVVLGLILIAIISFGIYENHYENLLIKQGYDKSSLELFCDYTGQSYADIYDNKIYRSELDQYQIDHIITNNMRAYHEASEHQDNENMAAVAIGLGAASMMSSSRRR